MERKIAGTKFGKTIQAACLMFLGVALLPLQGRERRGAQLQIDRIDGGVVRGELLTVKEETLVLSTGGREARVPIREARRVTLVRRSRAGSGFGTGMLMGAGLGILLGSSSGVEPEDRAMARTFLGLAGGGLFAVIGAVAGAAAGTDQHHRVDPADEAAIRTLLVELNQKARFPEKRIGSA